MPILGDKPCASAHCLRADAPWLGEGPSPLAGSAERATTRDCVASLWRASTNSAWGDGVSATRRGTWSLLPHTQDARDASLVDMLKGDGLQTTSIQSRGSGYRGYLRSPSTLTRGTLRVYTQRYNTPDAGGQYRTINQYLKHSCQCWKFLFATPLHPATFAASTSLKRSSFSVPDSAFDPPLRMSRIRNPKATSSVRTRRRCRERRIPGVRKAAGPGWSAAP